MKQQFSPKWISSSQVRKQRKYRHNAPLHIKHKFLSTHLSKDLRKKYGKRSLPLRKGDEVLVMRGAFKKKKAKVSSIKLKETKVALEGIQRTKRDGTKVNVYFAPRALKIESLNVEDKERMNSLQRKSSSTQNKPESKNASN